MTLEQLCTDYYSLAYRRCHFLVRDSELAQELAQDAFVRIIRAWPLEHEAAIGKYVFQSATWSVYSYWQRGKRDTVDLEEVADTLVDEASDPSISLEGSERFLAVWQHLPSEYQAVFGLLAEGYSPADIADMWGVPVRKVYGTVRQGREMVKRRYKAQEVAA